MEEQKNNISTPLKPKDFTDLGQSRVFVKEYGQKIRYSKATDFLEYNGKVWREDTLAVHLLSQQLTDRQLEEAEKAYEAAWKMTQKVIKETKNQDKAKIKQAREIEDYYKAYRNYVLGRRESKKIKATMTEAAPAVSIDVKKLDENGFLLNTPTGTINLRTGQSREHQPKDYCTKITAVAPSTKGEDTWREFLNELTVGDADLARYLQEVAGVCAIGAVKREELIIATGTGGNGKSTFFNLLFRVLGDYSGMLSAETLTTGSRKNKSPEYAELRGKRLIIAAELEEGTRLDTSTVKKLCSTDPIQAEKKYKDPFSFIPSHHVILYTNHLPKVGSSDRGTWDRLVVVPFMAKFRGTSGEIKDYTSYLFDKCGGAVLAWIIEGARRVIRNKFIIQQPKCVSDAIEEYRSDNDWLQDFISDSCVTAEKTRCAGGELYQAYADFCAATGEYKRSSKELSKAMEDAGYEKKKTKTGAVYMGIRIKTIAERKQAIIEARKEA